MQIRKHQDPNDIATVEHNFILYLLDLGQLINLKSADSVAAWILPPKLAANPAFMAIPCSLAQFSSLGLAGVYFYLKVSFAFLLFRNI